MSNIFLFSSSCFPALCTVMFFPVSPPSSRRQNKSCGTEAGSETCHLRDLFETKTRWWRGKNKQTTASFFFVPLKALLTRLRVTVAGVRRCGEEAGGSRGTASSLWVVSVHESSVNHSSTKRKLSPFVRGLVSQNWSLKISWDSRVVANVGGTSWILRRRWEGGGVYSILSQVCNNKTQSAVSCKATYLTEKSPLGAPDENTDCFMLETAKWFWWRLEGNKMFFVVGK